MPQYTLHRNHTHRSTKGVISFIKNEPTNVPYHMEEEVFAIGAIKVEGDPVDPIGQEIKPAPVLNDEERLFAIRAAFDQLIANNITTDFTGQGVPTAKAMEKLIGFELDRTEITAQWADYKVFKAEA